MICCRLDTCSDYKCMPNILQQSIRMNPKPSFRLLHLKKRQEKWFKCRFSQFCFSFQACHYIPESKMNACNAHMVKLSLLRLMWTSHHSKLGSSFLNLSPGTYERLILSPGNNCTSYNENNQFQALVQHGIYCKMGSDKHSWKRMMQGLQPKRYNKS